MPSLRYSIFALLPSTFTDLTPLATASPPLILTPSSVLPSSSAVSTNVALPADSGMGSAPNASLSRLMIGASLTVIFFPSSDFSVTPSVTVLTSVTRPFFIVNVNSETVEYPAGAVSSLSEYLPSLRYSSFVLLPANVADLTSPRASPSLILTPLSEPSVSLAVSVNSASPSVIIFPPRSVLSIDIVGASSTTIWPSSSMYVLPVVTADTFVTLPSFTVNVKSLTTE